MNKVRLFIIVGVLVGVTILAGTFSAANSEQTAPMGSTQLTGDKNFDKMMAVLAHPRCVNCHPDDHIPKQGIESHPHYLGIKRGEGKDKDHGFVVTNCNTCHRTENNHYSGVPGAPKWSLAPHSMRWEGLTKIEIAESMMDPERNGGKSPKEILHHLTEDELVLWAWKPGVDAAGIPRELPPVPKEEYIEAVENWFKEGAVIPQP